MYMYMYVYIYIYIHMYLSLSLYIYIYIYTYICRCKFVYVVIHNHLITPARGPPETATMGAFRIIMNVMITMDVFLFVINKLIII